MFDLEPTSFNRLLTIVDVILALAWLPPLWTIYAWVIDGQVCNRATKIVAIISTCFLVLLLTYRAGIYVAYGS